MGNLIRECIGPSNYDINKSKADDIVVKYILDDSYRENIGDYYNLKQFILGGDFANNVNDKQQTPLDVTGWRLEDEKLLKYVKQYIGYYWYRQPYHLNNEIVLLLVSYNPQTGFDKRVTRSFLMRVFTKIDNYNYYYFNTEIVNLLSFNCKSDDYYTDYKNNNDKHLLHIKKYPNYLNVEKLDIENIIIDILKILDINPDLKFYFNAQVSLIDYAIYYDKYRVIRYLLDRDVYIDMDSIWTMYKKLKGFMDTTLAKKQTLYAFLYDYYDKLDNISDKKRDEFTKLKSYHKFYALDATPIPALSLR